MKKLLFLFCMMWLLFMGCASTTTIPGPTFLVDDAPKHIVRVHNTNTNAFAPSTDTSYSLICDGESSEIIATVPSQEAPNLGECEMTKGVAHDAASGVVQGFITPSLSSYFMYRGTEEIGKGLGNSGDSNVTNNSTNVKSSTVSKSRGTATANSASSSSSSASGSGGGQHPGCRFSRCD